MDHTLTAEIMRRNKVQPVTAAQLEQSFPCPKEADPCDFMEVFSPPRIAPEVEMLGLKPGPSLDLLLGWNFLSQAIRDYALRLIEAFNPKMVHVCPPCTTFSVLWASNISRMHPDRVKAREVEGMTNLRFAAKLCHRQLDNNALFSFEHPVHASSWGVKAIQDISSRPGVKRAVFDQCRFGLVSKTSGKPMKKGTAILTNCPALYGAFHNQFCDCACEHQVVEGFEGGEKRASFSAKYPLELCQVFAAAVAYNTPGPP